MLTGFKPEVERYYLIDVGIDFDGNTYFNPLSKAWSSNNFVPNKDVHQAYKFKSLDEAIKMCKIQNMLNDGFESSNVCYVVKSNEQNTIYDQESQVTNPESIGNEDDQETV